MILILCIFCILNVYADVSLKKDKEMGLENFVKHRHYPKCVDESLKKDKEIVLAAVKNRGYSLKFADESLKKDKEVVLAITQ